MIPIQVTIIAASLVIGLSAGWLGNGWRLNGKIDRMVSEHSRALAQAGQNAMIESARLQGIKDEALNQANQIAQRNAAAAAAARSELSRLRSELASRSSLSNATCASARDYAATLATIFGECATRIGEMAIDADGHAADSRTYQQSFPK